MIVRLVATFAVFVVAVGALNGRAHCKTLLQNQIQYGRLSPEVLNGDPLFEVVAAGLPTGEFFALLSIRGGSCLLEIVDGRNGKIVTTFADHLRCAQEYEFEDGHSLYHAFQFRDFLNVNFKTVKRLLTRYKIDFSKFPKAVEIQKPNGDEGRQCVRLAGMRVCKGKGQRVVVEKIAE